MLYKPYASGSFKFNHLHAKAINVLIRLNSYTFHNVSIKYNMYIVLVISPISYYVKKKKKFENSIE